MSTAKPLSRPNVEATEREVAEARLRGNFDAIYEAGGADACRRALERLTSQLADRVRDDRERDLDRPGNEGWGA